MFDWLIYDIFAIFEYIKQSLERFHSAFKQSVVSLTQCVDSMLILSE